MNKFAMITRCDSKAKELAEVTHPIMKNYAEVWGCDFIVLGDEIEDTGDYEMNHYRVLRVQDWLEVYERVLIIDSDVVIMPGTPNPFDIVSPDKIGTIYEDVGSRQVHRRMVIGDIQKKFGNVGWETGYINTGFFICSTFHKSIFDKIDGELWSGFGFDDALIGYNINKYKFVVQQLSYKWNHTQMFSEPWNNDANRFDSYIIHYAGAARFPDDLSERKDLTNALSGRITLIKHDIERITEGLMTFTDAKPVEKQGFGSTVYDCKYGVQAKPIMLKVSNTEECFDREVANLSQDIPNKVYMLGSGSDPQVGSFIMLEKLEPLPDAIDVDLMDEIIQKTLETIRYCYLNHITWIPKLDHIMLDLKGNVKIVDFGDDPYEYIPFFGNEDEELEGVLMDGKCDNDGNYIMRYTYPLSGFRAIMQYLIDNNNNLDELGQLVSSWEAAMIMDEYQSLKDVHEPINHKHYDAIFRRESEPNDANFGKLVPANRDCKDRAKMLREHLPTYINTTEVVLDRKERALPGWFDIGCNVGWFQLEFAGDFRMVGIERDKEKADFAQMIADLTYVTDGKYATVYQGEVDVDWADKMPEYDIISAFSVLHLKLVEDKDQAAFWVLLEAICKKVKNIFFFEFPPHSYGLAGCDDTNDFIGSVQYIGKFAKVEQIGITDAGRPMLKCQK